MALWINTYPCGAQYQHRLNHLYGMAADILESVESFSRKKVAEVNIKKTESQRDYKRASRAKPIKRETEAMRLILKYITIHPGSTRGCFIDKALRGIIISEATVGYSVKALLDQKAIYSTGSQSHRRYYINNENKTIHKLLDK
jgi:hypothetical protein